MCEKIRIMLARQREATRIMLAHHHGPYKASCWSA
jgi:hypothetical protein